MTGIHYHRGLFTFLFFSFGRLLVEQEQVHDGGRASQGKSASATGAFFLLQTCNKKIIYLENEGHDHGVQHSQWYISMTNINLCKSHRTQFCYSSHSLAVALSVLL